METLNFQYPTWYLILCAFLGLAYALTLYFRDRRFKDTGRWLNGLLGILRFLAVSILATLLLTPLLKRIITDTKKPIVVLAQDQSESVNASMDSTALAQYKTDYQQLRDDLAGQYELREYAFGSDVREGVDFNFSDKVSNISEFLQTLYDQFSNQNLGAVILATDGVYNEGSNPIYSSTRLATPIYTVALGDTTPKRDLILKRVFHNKIAYLGDQFTIQVDIAAHNAQGASSNLIVSKVEGGRTVKLQQFPIAIDRADYFSTQEIVIEAKQAGVQRYRLSLNGITNEASRANNSKDIFVDVLDARQKVLILAHAPHPDLTAIKQSMSSNKNYEVEIALANRPPANITDFDLVILHQLPSAQHPIQSLLSRMDQLKMPRLYIAGLQSDFRQLSNAQPMLRFQVDGKNTNDVQAKINPAFSLFTLSENLVKELPKFAPLTAPFGDFKVGPNGSVLLHQRIGKIDTEYPLLVLGQENEVRTGVLAAEGLFKWRLFDFLQHENHKIFDELLGKTIQYISVKEDKRRFRVTASKNIFNENEEIFFDAELYNQSYELVNEPDVSLVLKNSEGKDFNYTMNKVGNSYALEAGVFPVGNYTFTGTVTSSGQKLTYNGQFSVQPIQLELYETTADHGMLRLLSEKYGGQLVYPAQVASVAQIIREQGTVKPVVYQTTKTRPVIHLKWIFFLLLGLLTLEWFLRRYFGSY